jgi:site-specific DNA-methyltransferase (adenine-specific)
MDKLIEKGVKFDAIITDPPYGTTDCSWDTIIPFNEMWNKIHKIIKEDTAIILFGNEPFSSLLRTSNLKLYKYDWKWDKIQGANFLNVKYQPLKNIEDIMVFSLGRITNGKRTPIKYNPQGFIEKIEEKINSSDYEGTFGSSSVKKGKEFKTTGTGYPKCLILFPKEKDKYHPTQKPVDLLEYLINTYTNENELILDFTCGSGTTLLASRNLKRKCIGIELEEKYCEIAKNRLIA